METVSIHAKNAIEMLLSVHALANMSRGASGHIATEHLRSAGDWLSGIESELRAMRREIEELAS